GRRFESCRGRWTTRSTPNSARNRPMRFAYAEAMCDVTHYAPLARACDEAGWDAMVVPDSICYPRDSDSTYPYTADGNREFLDGKPFIEPFVLIPALAAVTERLRFHTFVVKL